MWAIWLLMLITAATYSSPEAIPDDCPQKCGGVEVPYPFGIDDTSSAQTANPKCAINETFMFLCNSTFNPPRLFFGENMPIYNISVEEGTISVKIDSAFNCYNNTGLESNFSQSITLGDGLFTFSNSRNRLTVIGCDTLALMYDWYGNFVSACASSCSQNVTLEGSCSGFGCCQTLIPEAIKTLLEVDLFSSFNHSDVLEFNPCEFAFLADERTFNVSDWHLSDGPISTKTNEYVTSDVVIEWVVREETCEEAQSSNAYACKSNSNCIYSDNGKGYRCVCNHGFTGNPYIGCQDINECNDRENYPCDGHCKNTFGSYTCKCPLGMRRDDKGVCQGLISITTLGAVVGAVVLIMIIIILMVILYIRRRKEKNFLENGGMILKHQRVRIFTEAELVKATKNYDQSQLLGEGGFGRVYKGVLMDGTQIAVKKPKGIEKTQINQECQHEIGIVSQVNHRNVVKILGLCLETKVPLLAYEFISNGTLFHHIHHKGSPVLTNWKNRLRIALDSALALNYLHSLADPPIIHGDVKSSNILLDDNYTAKVSDFGASVLISPGQYDIATKIKGTLGYLDPEYLMTGCLTEKSDVYSFGVVLVELLTGEKPNSVARSGEKNNIIQYFRSSLESNNLCSILCFSVESEGEMEEIEVFAEIAEQCLHSSGLKRPTMKQVAENLGTLMRNLKEDSWKQDQNNEETQSLLGESSSHPINFGAKESNQHEILSFKTFEIDYPT